MIKTYMCKAFAVVVVLLALSMTSLPNLISWGSCRLGVQVFNHVHRNVTIRFLVVDNQWLTLLSRITYSDLEDKSVHNYMYYRIGERVLEKYREDTKGLCNENSLLRDRVSLQLPNMSLLSSDGKRECKVTNLTFEGTTEYLVNHTFVKCGLVNTINGSISCVFYNTTLGPPAEPSTLSGLVILLMFVVFGFGFVCGFAWNYLNTRCWGKRKKLLECFGTPKVGMNAVTIESPQLISEEKQSPEIKTVESLLQQNDSY